MEKAERFWLIFDSVQVALHEFALAALILCVATAWWTGSFVSVASSCLLGLHITVWPGMTAFTIARQMGVWPLDTWHKRGLLLLCIVTSPLLLIYKFVRDVRGNPVRSAAYQNVENDFAPLKSSAHRFAEVTSTTISETKVMKSVGNHYAGKVAEALSWFVTAQLQVPESLEKTWATYSVGSVSQFWFTCWPILAVSTNGIFSQLGLVIVTLLLSGICILQFVRERHCITVRHWWCLLLFHTADVATEFALILFITFTNDEPLQCLWIAVLVFLKLAFYDGVTEAVLGCVGAPRGFFSPILLWPGQILRPGSSLFSNNNGNEKGTLPCQAVLYSFLHSEHDDDEKTTWQANGKNNNYVSSKVDWHAQYSLTATAWPHFVRKVLVNRKCKVLLQGSAETAIIGWHMKFRDDSSFNQHERSSLETDDVFADRATFAMKTAVIVHCLNNRISDGDKVAAKIDDARRTNSTYSFFSRYVQEQVINTPDFQTKSRFRKFVSLFRYFTVFLTMIVSLVAPFVMVYLLASETIVPRRDVRALVSVTVWISFALTCISLCFVPFALQHLKATIVHEEWARVLDRTANAEALQQMIELYFTRGLTHELKLEEQVFPGDAFETHVECFLHPRAVGLFPESVELAFQQDHSVQSHSSVQM